MSRRRAGRLPGGSASPHDGVVRITTAAASPDADIAARQRRYLISMAIRTACVVGAVVVGPGVLRWVLVAGAVFLPYVAVVMANATNRRSDGFQLRTGQPGAPELGPGPAARD
ncbi:DUF3099 domain-containing protein [Nocardioides sp.]|uniref:DUF3099 domain-containing protein n=1 Tax=Nocardioides sp. TaxID=35761 RepID=UPI002732425D|nr:DUF3099 domain-containing protein [Nocardioides sp.]MDP3890175.1 DUF3099 domain-containing protein [Nocardioides sp.]